MVVDLFLVFQFIKKLVTPFTKWPAFKLGIIDAKGNIVIRRKDFTKKEQSKLLAYSTNWLVMSKSY